MLAVGDSTRLEIILSTKGVRGMLRKSPKIYTNEGKAVKSVRVESNIMNRPDSTYPLVLKPYKLDISQFGDKVRDEIKFRLANVSQDDVEVKLLVGASEYFSVDLPGKIKAGEDAEATLKLTDKAIEETFDKSFTLECNDEQATRFTIPVKRALRQQPPRASAGK